ncbi:MAG: hypothetical protein C0517_06645 [Erythrobacter sp.]|nr:hypothetical protein [Erythrobacter sp.]
MPVAPRSTAIVLPERLILGDHAIHPEQIMLIPERRPYGEGPWRDEPDRVAWRDAQTGYSCLILRQRNGALAGYVAVPRSHPLWCYERDAIPLMLGITAHRGIDYAALCDQKGAPALQICHVHLTTGRQHHASTTNGSKLADNNHADAWWFGFACDKAGDFLPGDRSHNDRRREDNPKVYRDIGYVAAEVLKLASTLYALDDQSASDDGQGPPDTGVPLALDPKPNALLPRKGGRHE